MTSADALARALRYHNAGELAAAEQIYRQILAIDPRHADSLHLLGVIAHQAGRSDAAPGLIREAIAINPAVPEYHNNLGNILKETGGSAEAIECYLRAIALKPDFVDAHYNLGNTYAKDERLQEATDCYAVALRLNSTHAGSWINLGNALRSLGSLDEALRSYAQVPTNDPAFAEARWNQAIARLLAGDLERGWEDYEGRWDLERAKPRRRNFAQPLWQGEPLAAQTILIHAEQGFGDTLQFARYLPMVKERGARVIVECQAQLTRVIGTIEGIDEMIAAGHALPAFDSQIPLLSLPRVFRTQLATIPGETPYIKVDQGLARIWRERLEPLGARTAIGLTWAGGTSDPKRDCTLASLAPLAAATQGAVFVSLQKGEAAAQASSPPVGMRLIDWSDELNDFADTAALISALDLVISVDTSIPHLAGALGKPVWTLLRFAPDWRWLLNRDGSPWYPSMRLFRQDQPGSWRAAIARAADGLARLAGAQPALRTTR